MADVVFRADEDGIADLARSAGVRAEIRRRGAAVADRAKSTARVVSGTYRDSIHVVEHDDGSVTVESGVPYAMKQEALTGNLVRALDAAAG